MKQALELVRSKTKDIERVGEIIVDKVRQTDNVKSAIDLLTTKTALEQDGVVEKLVDEKAKELTNDAETKKIYSETQKIKEEKEKEIAEFDKIIFAKQKEIEQLKVEADKAQAFFDSNKDILRYIGIREKKSLKTMQALMFPATIVFVIIQVLLFPLTLIGLVLETIVNILGGICGAIKNNALKIMLSVLVVMLLVGGGFLVYFYGGKLIINN